MCGHERQFILRWIMWTMCNLKLLEDKDFVEVATMAVRRYPALQSSLNQSVEGVVRSLKDIKRNRNYYSNKKSKLEQTSVNDPGSTKNLFQSTKDQNLKEWAEHSPSFVTLKALLNSCRKQRLALAKKQDCRTHLKEFPCLSDNKLLFWEFVQQELLDITQDDIKMRWLNALPEMRKYFSSHQRRISPTLTDEQASVEVLHIMTHASFFGPRKPMEKRERKSFVIEIFKEKTLLNKTVPALDDPPRLFAIGDLEKGNLNCQIYVDGRAFYSGEIVESLAQLVALYYVFEIAPATDVRAAFSFLFGVLMQEAAEKEYKKYKSVLKALEIIARPQL